MGVAGAWRLASEERWEGCPRQREQHREGLEPGEDRKGSGYRKQVRRGWSFPRSQSWLEGQSQILTQAKLLPAWGSPPLAGVGGSSLQQSEKTGDSLRSRGPGGGQEAGHRDMAKGRVGGLQPQILTKRSVLVRVGGRLDWVGLRIAPPPQRRPWGSPNPDIRVHLVVSRICGRHTRQKEGGGCPVPRLCCEGSNAVLWMFKAPKSRAVSYHLLRRDEKSGVQRGKRPARGHTAYF